VLGGRRPDDDELQRISRIVAKAQMEFVKRHGGHSTGHNVLCHGS
jgi:hypothetical protein